MLITIDVSPALSSFCLLFYHDLLIVLLFLRLLRLVDLCALLKIAASHHESQGLFGLLSLVLLGVVPLCWLSEPGRLLPFLDVPASLEATEVIVGFLRNTSTEVHAALAVHKFVQVSSPLDVDGEVGAAAEATSTLLYEGFVQDAKDQQFDDQTSHFTLWYVLQFTEMSIRVAVFQPCTCDFLSPHEID